MVKEEEKPHVQPAAFTYLQQPRNPPNFSGKGSELAHIWLKDYSRVAAHNGWNESMCLANVVFFLEGAARCWFDNVEESITTWNTFKEEFTRTFGDKEDYARRIESSLKVRAQKPDESVELYIQDVLNLCRQLNPNMSEEDRVGHLMKGVAENIYRALLAIEVTTTGEFTQHCRRIEKLNKNRISSVRFERIPTVSAINENEYHPLKEMIREIIREELRSAPNELDNLPPSQGLEDRVWQRVEQNLAPIDKAPVFHSRRAVKNFRSGQQNAGEAVRRKTDEFRTRENIPICFYCNRPGHVAKHCWDRHRDRDENEPSRTQSRFYYGRRRPGSIYMSDFMTPHMNNLIGTTLLDAIYQERRAGKLGSTACKGGKVGHCLKPPQTRADLDDNYMWVSINGRHVEALIDTGASYSVVSSNFRKSMKAIMFESPNITLRVANNRFVAPLGKCRLRVEINGLQRIFEFLVLPNCSHDAILGWDFLESSKAVIDCGHSEISFSETLNEDQSAAQLHLASDDIIPPKCTKRVLTRTPSVTGIKNCAVEVARQLFLEKELFVLSSYLTIWHGQAYLWVTNFSKHPKTIPSGMCLAHLFRVQPQEVCPIMENHSNNKSKSAKSPIRITNFECREENFFKVGSSEQLMRMEQISACISPELPLLHKTKLLELLDNFSEVFGPIDKTTSRIITKHRINTGDAKPSKKMPYRVSPSERKVIQEEVDRMMEMGVVQPSESPWASPVVLVRKKDGSVRFCVDYRGLNKMTKKDVYPLPRVGDALDCLKGANIYSTIDLKAGYWQIGIDEADREKTAFITPDGLFEFKVMPFGLCNAPATFERMMDNLLKGLRWTICLCYLDDVIPEEGAADRLVPSGKKE
ncbi:K02A2.6-like [Cordylochernes scorpioides]|uniref:K02A2.6-like n=1 Tax=Cordylochernes scorpioides TaxID=51811 RepID=A0ABY6KZ35_9ARAC|nr:K02A2.6-like [Cordylochernes scorpioides]